MVTSSIPSEGKSSVSVNLALSLAREGKKVLLIDGDLRGPSDKALLGLTKPSDGLGQCLSGSLGQVHFLRYEDTSLYVFAGSEPIHTPMNLLQYDKLEALMNTLRPMFDYIVLDTPPCAMMADALALSRHVDRVIYVIREDFAATTQIFEGSRPWPGPIPEWLALCSTVPPMSGAPPPATATATVTAMATAMAMATARPSARATHKPLPGPPAESRGTSAYQKRPPLFFGKLTIQPRENVVY